MNIGEQIIEAVEINVHVVDPFGTVFANERHLIWNKNAGEQLEAVVEAHINERVRVRLELDRQEWREKHREADEIIRELIRQNPEKYGYSLLRDFTDNPTPPRATD